MAAKKEKKTENETSVCYSHNNTRASVTALLTSVC